MKRYIHYAVLLIFTVAAYWQLALLKHPPMWDAIDQAFQWRYFVAECVHNGHLPAWMPYQNCGYPFDPQSGAWYPVGIIIGLLTRYTIYIFQLEYIATIFVAAVGMYHLVRTFSINSEAALFGGICYAACGFFISNAEHLCFVVSAAWLPWVFWAYHRMLQTMKYGYALAAGIFQSLLLSGGYPAFLIIDSYILLIISIGSFISKRDSRGRKLLIKNNVVFALAFLLPASIGAFSFAEALPYITRGGGVTADKAGIMPFSPQCSLSFILPFASIKNNDFFLTDISMRNAYFGIVSFAVMVTGIFTIRESRLRTVLAVAVICLLASFGPYFPLRKLLYEYAPLMNQFRYSSIFRLFSITGFIIIAAAALQQLLTHPLKYRKTLALFTVSLILILFLLMGYELHKYGTAGNYSLFFRNIYDFLQQSLFYQHIIIQSAVQMLLLFILLFLLLYKHGKYFTAHCILLLCATDLFMATQLNMYGTVASHERTKEIYLKTQALPKGFPVPDDHTPLSAVNNGTYHGALSPLVHNLSTLEKRAAFDGYDPFVLRSYVALAESNLKDSVWANPYLYFAYGIMPVETNANLSSHTIAAAGHDAYTRLKDTLFSKGNDSIYISSFVPGHITATTFTGHNTILVLQQACYPGWKVLIDGKEALYFATAYSNISIFLPPGNHHILFDFNPWYLYPLVMISLISFAGILIYMIVYRKKLF